MEELNKFYYNLLNIKRKSINYELIKKIVISRKKELLNYTSDIDGLCKVCADLILDQLNKEEISTIYFNTQDICNNSYEHIFLLSYYEEDGEIKYVLIDPTYSQFVKKDAILNSKFKVWPSEKLKQTKKGELLLNSLINDGLSLVDNESINEYLNSFSELKNEFDLNSCFITYARKY